MVDVPSTRRDDTVDDLHGHRIADPYRWLEDPDTDETRAWVAAQNAATEEHLGALPERAWFAETMAAILQRPRAGVPMERGGRLLVNRNDGQHDQDVWSVAETLDELLAGGRVLIDVNQLSADGTSALTSLAVSPDGRIALYGVSDGGSDWETLRLVDLETTEPLDEQPIQTKFADPTFLPDGRSYLYTHFDHEGFAEGTETAALPTPQLRLHRIGTTPGEDAVVLEFPDQTQRRFWTTLTDDDAYLAVTLVDGTETRNRLWVYPVSTVDGVSVLGPAVRVVDDAVAEFVVAGIRGRTLFLHTDHGAERGRLVSVDLDRAEESVLPVLTEVVAEEDSTLLDIRGAADGFLAVRLVDASPVVVSYCSDGSLQRTWDLSGGAVVGLDCAQDRVRAFVGLSSVTAPTTSYLLDLESGATTALNALVPTSEAAYAAPIVSTSRRRAASADGTAVPYFLVTGAEDDLADDLTEPRPTLMWGYGGFKIPIATDYRPGWSGWLAAGGRLVIANLRGGGEFGTEWYEAGRLANKQNVFDDFIAVAEQLQSTGVTTRDQLALHGRSNGGLLVGAVMTQRPDLAAVALPGVGVLDMLRFHLFTVGAAWVSDYGDPEDPAQFADALAYSPLHHVVPGTAYPATLVLTGDHDDRVVPLHSHKFTATLQAAQRGPAPILTRIETATGHGAGKPAALQAAEWADLLAFAAHHTGLRI